MFSEDNDASDSSEGDSDSSDSDSSDSDSSDGDDHSGMNWHMPGGWDGWSDEIPGGWGGDDDDRHDDSSRHHDDDDSMLEPADVTAEYAAFDVLVVTCNVQEVDICCA